MGIHELVPSITAIFDSSTMARVVGEWATAAAPFRTKVVRASESVDALDEDRAQMEPCVIATDVMPRIYAISSVHARTAPAASLPSWRSDSSVPDIDIRSSSIVANEPIAESSIVTLSDLVSKIYEPTLRLARLHVRSSIVFIADRPARGDIVKPPKEETRRMRGISTENDRMRRGVSAPSPYSPCSWFDVPADVFVETDGDGNIINRTHSIDVARLLVSPETMAAFYLYFATKVRESTIFNDVHFDMPGCATLRRAPIDPTAVVLPDTFEPSHAFSEGDNAILYVARRCPPDVVFHAITADTDAVVMLACVLMLSPDNDGLFDPDPNAPQRRAYWHSILSPDGDVRRERVWSIHAIARQFVAMDMPPWVILATAILVGCDFLPPKLTLKNIGSVNVWSAVVRGCRDPALRDILCHPVHLNAVSVFTAIYTHVISVHLGYRVTTPPLTNADLHVAWGVRVRGSCGRLKPSITEPPVDGSSTLSTVALFVSAWQYLFVDVLSSTHLQLMSPMAYVTRRTKYAPGFS